MTTDTTFNAASVLFELDRHGIKIAVKGDRLSLQPGSKVPAWLMEIIRQRKAGLLTIVADPRRRWRSQAEALIASRSADDHEDLLHVFDEREAIASVDGGLDDDYAGQLAYITLKNHIQEDV